MHDVSLFPRPLPGSSAGNPLFLQKKGLLRRRSRYTVKWTNAAGLSFLLFLVPFYYRLRAIRIPPTMQASSNKLMTSNGSR